MFQHNHNGQRVRAQKRVYRKSLLLAHTIFRTNVTVHVKMSGQHLTRRVTHKPDERMALSFICGSPPDVHDFTGDGVPTSDWELHVEVTQSHNPGDKDGEVIKPRSVEPNARHYEVDAGMHVRVSIGNESTTQIVEFELFWLDETGDEWREDPVKLDPAYTAGGCSALELPCFRKDYSDNETSWLLKDAHGRHVLKLHFHVKE